MRLIHVAALSIVACGLVSAADTHEATYVVGNLDSVVVGAEGVLTLDSDKLVFHAGKATVEAPYKKVTEVQLGPTLTHSVDVPLYRVWELHKRFLAERPTFQNLTLIFAGDDGKARSMTLELLESATLETYDTILIRTGRKPRHPKEDWWGDSYWRTTRTDSEWKKRNADDEPVK
jgi:hypothetical protein